MSEPPFAFFVLVGGEGDGASASDPGSGYLMLVRAEGSLPICFLRPKFVCHGTIMDPTLSSCLDSFSPAQKKDILRKAKATDCPIYIFKFKKFEDVGEGTIKVHWKVYVSDTLWEQNGQTYYLIETMDKDGQVLEDVRTYKEKPYWPFTPEANPPEYIHYPCTITFGDDTRRFESPEEV